MAHEFHIVDVFATERYAGNQLAVVTGAGDLADETMQAIAREFGYSETTFVEGRDDDGWHVRIFTPAEEIPFAGHPTLGTAWVIREQLATGSPDPVLLHLEVGDVPVRVEDGSLWMTQQAPSFGQEFEREAAAAALGLDPGAVTENLPVQAVSTGLPTIVVPLRDREALETIEVDRPAYDALTEGHDAKNLLAYCSDPRDEAHDYAVRVFAPYYGVPEDPATGSSNGCLAGYLARHRGGVDAVVEQGYEMGRPSLLELRANRVAGDVHVEVGGDVVPVADGTLR
ncbi:PhzF family phenazine biosynthesis protein [Haloarchaeobius amylolyticus]|uniref:PhzF family phenazine biosynthesis protein n=1 Tax=Haloarchaeobius amylolyticus TaxID=1198296 RepID=UPI002270F2CB|nr:PhzF family phenazine biosynthesis protein [Haloarchaeobius amylolyticus]